VGVWNGCGKGEMPESNWGSLMAAALAGDERAYATLLSALRPWLKRYYARRLPPAMVEDAAQETLIAVHEKRHTYDPSRPFEPWLAAIARYKWIDRLRAMKRAPTQALDEDFPVADHGAKVTEALILEQLLADLKPAQAAAIQLVKLQGYSVEEAANRTGQSATLVRVNIHRGLARLASAAKRHALVNG